MTYPRLSLGFYLMLGAVGVLVVTGHGHAASSVAAGFALARFFPE